jgi:hypothetical protein
MYPVYKPGRCFHSFSNISRLAAASEGVRPADLGGRRKGCARELGGLADYARCGMDGCLRIGWSIGDGSEGPLDRLVQVGSGHRGLMER